MHVVDRNEVNFAYENWYVKWCVWGEWCV